MDTQILTILASVVLFGSFTVNILIDKKEFRGRFISFLSGIVMIMASFFIGALY